MPGDEGAEAGETDGDTLEDRGLDPSKDYTDSIPMKHSTRWIDHDNLEVLAGEAAIEEFGERAYDVEAAVVGVKSGNADEDWMRESYGHRFRRLEGAVEEKAAEYRAQVFDQVESETAADTKGAGQSE